MTVKPFFEKNETFFQALFLSTSRQTCITVLLSTFSAGKLYVFLSHMPCIFFGNVRRRMFKSPNQSKKQNDSWLGCKRNPRQRALAFLLFVLQLRLGYSSIPVAGAQNNPSPTPEKLLGSWYPVGWFLAHYNRRSLHWSCCGTARIFSDQGRRQRRCLGCQISRLWSDRAAFPGHGLWLRLCHFGRFSLGRGRCPGSLFDRLSPAS